MTIACAAQTRSSRPVSEVMKRLTCIAFTRSELLNNRGTRAASSLASLSPVDAIVDRLDRSCERHARGATR